MQVCQNTCGIQKMSHWHETSEGLGWQSSEQLPGKWAIRWHAVTPGLYWSATGQNKWYGPFLGTIGLTASGQTQDGTLNESNLTQIEVIRDRCEFSFAPSGWHDTTVRFVWSPVGPADFDLMTEVSTRSVGLLRGVELGIESSAWLNPEKINLWYQSTRDELAAKRSVDGRESGWIDKQNGFETDNRVSGSRESKRWLATCLTSSDGQMQFLEGAHPFDISRRYRDSENRSQRTWVLGHDMERGVVFRARNRGRFVSPLETVNSAMTDLWQKLILDEPLPLYR